MAKDARLMIRLEQGDLDWIKEEADKIGLDAATFVRSMIRKARNGIDHAPSSGRYLPESASAYSEEYAPMQSGPIEIDIDALAEQETRPDAFPVARPGDMDAVRPVGGRAPRNELLGTFSGRK